MPGSQQAAPSFFKARPHTLSMVLIYHNEARGAEACDVLDHMTIDDGDDDDDVTIKDA